jgi:hypothetical protein
MEMEKSPDIGIENYVAPVNKEQRLEDQKQYNAAKIARGETLEQADVSIENLEKAELDKVEVADGEPWWTTPDDELNRIIGESDFAEWLTSMEDYGGEWTKDFIVGLKKNYDNKEWFKLAGKLWLGGKGIKWGSKLLWSLVPFKPGSKLTTNMVKVVIAGETYQIATELDSDIPLFEQIQTKVDEIIAASTGAAGGPEVVEVDGDGTVIVDDDKDDKKDDKKTTSALDVLSNEPSLFSQYSGTGETSTSSPTSVFDAGAQQQGYTGNIMDMFTNLWNPNPETMDYWYKTREGDIPGNNRMREAMARLAYMGLYPEDRGTDPYQALSDDRITYNNNQLDAASSQATLNATAANRQYTQWKNMLPKQNELAKQLVETAGWSPFGMSQDELDKKAQRDAGALLRKFHGLMAKGVAPTPDNLRVANALETAGIPVNAQTVQYALENGLLDDDTGSGDNDDGGGKSKVSSILSNAQGFMANVKNAFL